jgi:hypothetical protein
MVGRHHWSSMNHALVFPWALGVGVNFKLRDSALPNSIADLSFRPRFLLVFPCVKLFDFLNILHHILYFNS